MYSNHDMANYVKAGCVYSMLKMPKVHASPPDNIFEEFIILQHILTSIEC